VPSYQADRFVSISYGGDEGDWTLVCGFTALPDLSGYRSHRWLAEFVDDAGAGGSVLVTVNGDTVVYVPLVTVGSHEGSAPVSVHLGTGDVDVTVVLDGEGSVEGAHFYMGDGDIETPPFTLWYVCDDTPTRLRQRQSRVRTPSRIRPPDLRQRQNTA